VQQIYDECARLKYHPGFPNGVQLQCPIFSQDKWKYLEQCGLAKCHSQKAARKPRFLLCYLPLDKSF
jgi:hypothetical protein